MVWKRVRNHRCLKICQLMRRALQRHRMFEILDWAFPMPDRCHRLAVIYFNFFQTLFPMEFHRIEFFHDYLRIVHTIFYGLKITLNQNIIFFVDVPRILKWIIWREKTSFFYSIVGIPHSDPHTSDDMEIKPGIAEMIREEERVSLIWLKCFIFIWFLVD